MESTGLSRPAKLTLLSDSSCNAEKWTKFEEEFQWYLAGENLTEAEEPRKLGLLLTIAGPEAQDVYRTFVYDSTKKVNGKAEGKYNYMCVLEKFKEYCVPTKNIVYMRGQSFIEISRKVNQ